MVKNNKSKTKVIRKTKDKNNKHAARSRLKSELPREFDEYLEPVVIKS